MIDKKVMRPKKSKAERVSGCRWRVWEAIETHKYGVIALFGAESSQEVERANIAIRDACDEIDMSLDAFERACRAQPRKLTSAREERLVSSKRVSVK